MDGPCGAGRRPRFHADDHHFRIAPNDLAVAALANDAEALAVPVDLDLALVLAGQLFPEGRVDKVKIAFVGLGRLFLFVDQPIEVILVQREEVIGVGIYRHHL